MEYKSEWVKRPDGWEVWNTPINFEAYRVLPECIEDGGWGTGCQQIGGKDYNDDDKWDGDIMVVRIELCPKHKYEKELFEAKAYIRTKNWENRK